MIVIPSQDSSDDEQLMNSLKEKDDKKLIVERQRNWVKLKLTAIANAVHFRVKLDSVKVHYSHINVEHNFTFALIFDFGTITK
jgi:hypothetical protein